MTDIKEISEYATELVKICKDRIAYHSKDNEWSESFNTGAKYAYKEIMDKILKSISSMYDKEGHQCAVISTENTSILAFSEGMETILHRYSKEEYAERKKISECADEKEVG